MGNKKSVRVSDILDMLKYEVSEFSAEAKQIYQDYIESIEGYYRLRIEIETIEFQVERMEGELNDNLQKEVVILGTSDLGKKLKTKDMREAAAKGRVEDYAGKKREIDKKKLKLINLRNNAKLLHSKSIGYQYRLTTINEELGIIRSMNDVRATFKGMKKDEVF